MGWPPESPLTVTVYWDETLVATWGAQRNILHITGRERAQPVIKWSVAAAAAVVGGRDVWGNKKKGKNRCQSSLHTICHFSKFQIIPQLRSKMKARMFPTFDILINYLPSHEE